MKFNLGDKVKFMDQEGQGTVTKIISAATVGVTVDGFEIPCPITDLIKMDAPSSTAERLFYEGKATYGDPQKDATEEKPQRLFAGKESVRLIKKPATKPIIKIMA